MKKLFTLCLLAFAAGVIQLHANFTVTSGDYKVTFNGYKTIQTISYKNVVICNGNGYNATIVILPSIPEVKGPRFIGSGHKEGGVEKILSLEVITDGVSDTNPGRKVFNGSNVKVIRISQCDKLKVTYTIEVSADGVKVSSQIEALENQALAGIYVHQFCFTEKTSEWIARMHNDAMFSGKFESKGAFHLHRTALRTLWFAMYIPESQIGFTAILDDDTAMAGGCRFWDRSNSHKLYYQPGFAKELQAGWKSMVYTMTIKGFTAPEASWKAAAEEQAEGGVEE